MDTFWLKLAVVAVVLIVGIGAVVMWTSKGIEEAQNPEQTFSDMVEKDKEELLAEPSAQDLTKPTEKPEETTATRPDEKSEPIAPSKPAEPVTFYFTELSEIDQIEAERLLALLPSGRSIGRLPTTGYNLMVKTCRQMMERWPGSIYDYKARRALAQMPERFRDRYKITEEDIDLIHFTRIRPRTKPYTIKEDD
jgi:hypothetical protein